HDRGRLAAALPAGSLVVAMIEPTLERLPVSSTSCALRFGAGRGLAGRPAEQLPAIAGAAHAEHELTPPAALEAKLLVVVHRLGATTGNLPRSPDASIVSSRRRPSAEGLELRTRGPRSFRRPR